jgi:hypothetical protein
MVSKRMTAAVLGLMVGPGSAGVRADDAPANVDNPIFVAWSKFDVDVTVSYRGELPRLEGKPMALTHTDTLKEKNADNVKVESVSVCGDHSLFFTCEPAIQP